MEHKSEILLETGTNELEILEFVIDDSSFGINVAKIKELMQYHTAQPIPHSEPHIEGVYKPRNEVLTVVNLASYLGLKERDDKERDILIITTFNKVSMAFHVEAVETIHRISWQDIEKPDMTIFGGKEGVITGIAKIKDKIIAIVDFEKIVFDICPAASIKISEVTALGPRERCNKPILIAEDSALLRKLMTEAMEVAGYTNVKIAHDGQEAWEHLQAIRNEAEPAENVIAALITDIEMPRCDGHHLCNLVRNDPYYKKLPILIFSSLIEEAMKIKGLELGVDAQLSKPEIGNLVTTLDEIISR